jgi:CheY-like chemotaxis protein
MTANAMVGDHDRCMAAGMNDYIAKPVDWPMLMEKVAHWTLKQHDAGDRNPVAAA